MSETNESLAMWNALSDAEKRSVAESALKAYSETKRALLAAAEERDALAAIVAVSACPDCASTYRRERNGGPCRYVWHDMREALVGKAAS